ncbi:unnamed protein product [Sphenostylis stenocarpa]|uniref:WRKY domain-containing protein n=1 Tax=Sphenostylis stenocarpa TaxID=92480 RepID=A0AA86VJE2_9FABA|nr:unnamed protein product [Sphenostylis stenocarpa]
MEESLKCEQVGLIDELILGKELAKKLCDHLLPSSSSTSSSHETNEVLIEKIISTYEKAIAMLNCKANVGESKAKNGSKRDSHCSLTNGSPRSEVMEPEFEHKNVSKKRGEKVHGLISDFNLGFFEMMEFRKTMPRWTEQVKLCLGTAEGSLEDGYSWRKYGQKDILGAKFPRGYYRCTYRNIQGCLATKQLQKSDEDPMMYEITYIGRHTCTQVNHLNKAVVPPSKTKMCIGENKHQTHQKNQPQEEKIEQPPETIFSFGSPALEVKVEGLDHMEDIFPSFCFSSPSIGSENEDNNNIFSYTMIENNLMESFISPPTSESNMFCHWGSTGLGQSVHSSPSDITDIVSTSTSVTTSPIMDLDFLLDKIDFDIGFPINTTELCT